MSPAGWVSRGCWTHGGGFGADRMPPAPRLPPIAHPGRGDKPADSRGLISPPACGSGHRARGSTQVRPSRRGLVRLARPSPGAGPGRPGRMAAGARRLHGRRRMLIGSGRDNRGRPVSGAEVRLAAHRVASRTSGATGLERQRRRAVAAGGSGPIGAASRTGVIDRPVVGPRPEACETVARLYRNSTGQRSPSWTTSPWRQRGGPPNSERCRPPLLSRTDSSIRQRRLPRTSPQIRPPTGPSSTPTCTMPMSLLRSRKPMMLPAGDTVAAGTVARHRPEAAVRRPELRGGPAAVEPLGRDR